MSYSVNPSAFKSIFAVPADIVDKHIRLANGDQLKVLLWILRNSPDNPNISEMCAALKMNESDAADYLQYWVLTGILKDDENNCSLPASSTSEVPKPISATPKTISAAKAEFVTSNPSKPSSSEIAKRIDESPEIGHLFNEAQQKLGKTIGYDGQCTLLLLHDHYGLPAEVLFMMIDYCVSIGKTNYGYLEAVGKDWGNREIDTLDKAAEQISILRKINTVWSQFARSAGIANPRPTVKQSEYLRRWNEEWKFSVDMIILAYEEMANHTGKLSWGYIEKILGNWKNHGYQTPADVEKAAAEQKSKIPAGNKSDSPSTASYDLDEFKEQSLHGDLKYERKNRK